MVQKRELQCVLKIYEGPAPIYKQNNNVLNYVLQFLMVNGRTRVCYSSSINIIIIIINIEASTIK